MRRTSIRLAGRCARAPSSRRSRHRRQHVGLADLPPRRRSDDVGEVARQRRQPAPGLGDQVQHPELTQHVGVPVGPRPDQPRQSPHTVGEGAGAGVDETCRERPTCRSAPAPDRRDRCASGPPASDRARPDLPSSVPPARHASGHDRRRRWRARRSDRDGRRAHHRIRCSRSGCRCRGAAPDPVRGDGRGRRSTPPRRGRAASGTPPRIHSSRSASVLARRLAARARHRHATSTWSTVVSYGSAPDPRQRPHSARSSAPVVDQRRHRERFGGRDGVGTRRDRDDLLHGPARCVGHRLYLHAAQTP